LPFPTPNRSFKYLPKPADSEQYRVQLSLLQVVRYNYLDACPKLDMLFPSLARSPDCPLRDEVAKMRLSELVTHTSTWLGLPHTEVQSFARFMREAREISVGTTGGGAAQMTDDDKINLLLAVCGCSTARTAATHYKYLKAATVLEVNPRGLHFAFLQHRKFTESLIALLTVDMANGGAVTSFIEESERHAAEMSINGHLHDITVDFFVDNYSAEITIDRAVLDPENPDRIKRHETADARFAWTFDLENPGLTLPISHRRGYAAESKLFRRLDKYNLRGWASCLDANSSGE
jgi:hypothetical protein